MKEALLYEKLSDQRVRCDLCAHRCVIAPGRKGVCKVRENRDGKLYTLVYGIPLSQAVDPIEKKPLFHFTLAALPSPSRRLAATSNVTFARTPTYRRCPAIRGASWAAKHPPSR